MCFDFEGKDHRSDSGQWHSKPFTVSLLCVAINTDCNRTVYRLDAGEWKDGNSFEIAADGNHRIEFYSVSAEGENEAIRESWAGLDTNKPKLGGWLGPVEGKNLILLKWNPGKDEGSGVSHYSVYRDNNRIGESTELAFTDSTAKKGQAYYYSISVTDLAGNESPREKPVAAKLLDENIQEEKETPTHTASPARKGGGLLEEYSDLLLPMAVALAVLLVLLVLVGMQRHTVKAPDALNGKRPGKKPGAGAAGKAAGKEGWEERQKEETVRKELSAMKERLRGADLGGGPGESAAWSEALLPKEEEKRKLDGLIRKLKEDLSRLRK